MPGRARHPEGGTASGASERWDVLVAVKNVVWVVPALQRLETGEGLLAECCADALDRLVGLHVVDVAAADRPRLDRGRSLTRPGDGLFVERGVLPGRHHADVERR